MLEISKIVQNLSQPFLQLQSDKAVNKTPLLRSLYTWLWPLGLKVLKKP